MVLFAAMLLGSGGFAADVWTGKKVSVLGDSYSAYKGAPGCIHYGYPNAQVTQQGQMWWAQAINALGGQLEMARACTGSAVYTTYGVCPSMWYMASTNGPTKECGLGNPDVILVMGGLNDFWVLQPAKHWGASVFQSHVSTLFGRLESEYPRAEKIVVVGKIHSWQAYRWGLEASYRNVLREEARRRKFRVVDLDGYLGTEDGDFDTVQYPHPTLQGMNKIAKRVVSVVRHGEGDCQRTFDCLEMDEQGYMVTDYVPNLARTKIEVRMREVEVAETNVVFSAGGFVQGEATNGNVFALARRTGGYRYANQVAGSVDCGPAIGLSPEEGDGLVTLTVEGNALTLGDYALHGKTNAVNVLASGPLVFGATRNGSNDVFSGMSPKRIYSVKIWEGASLVRDYVPAHDINGRATLYDRINDDALAVSGGQFAAFDYDGLYVNDAQCRGYDDLQVAYASAASGECIRMCGSPETPVVITGRLDVVINTMGHTNVTLASPSREYKGVSSRGILHLILDEDVVPHFECERISDLFLPVGGQLRVRVANVIDGSTYSLYTATEVAGPWTCVGTNQDGEFLVSAPTTPSFFLKMVAELPE